jgi:hypothetical protein
MNLKNTSALDSQPLTIYKDLKPLRYLLAKRVAEKKTSYTVSGGTSPILDIDVRDGNLYEITFTSSVDGNITINLQYFPAFGSTASDQYARSFAFVFIPVSPSAMTKFCQSISISSSNSAGTSATLFFAGGKANVDVTLTTAETRILQTFTFLSASDVYSSVSQFSTT